MDKVQSALAAGVLVAQMSGNIRNYQCEVCHRTVSDPLPHLQGKDHYNHLAWYTLQHPSPPQQFLSDLPDVVQAAKRNNEVQPLDKTVFSYRCLVCPKRSVSTGIRPLQEHLNGSDHKKAKVTRLSPSAPSPAVLQPISSPELRSDAGALAVRCDSMNKGTLHPDIENALQARVVTRTSDNSFRCLSCSKDHTGPAPLLEHLKSDKHKKKVSAQPSQNALPQPLPDFRTLSLADDGRPLFQSPVSGVGRPYQVEEVPWTFPWTSVSTSPPTQPDENVYRNLSVPRGLVLIFNYCFTGNANHERQGAPRDTFNIRTLFSRMGYQVYAYENLSKTETKEALQKTQDNPFLRDFDSLIVFVLSHGKDETHFYTNSGTPEDCMALDDVRYCFTDTHCPALKDKPKLFFVNFCRGNLKEPQTQYDSMAVQETAPRDMATVYACLPKFQAVRDPQFGTIFVQVWCEVLAAHAHNKELQDLNYKAGETMVSRKASTSEIQNIRFKRFFFNPVQQ